MGMDAVRARRKVDRQGRQLLHGSGSYGSGIKRMGGSENEGANRDW
jgi:hypothetical protein